MKVSVLLSLIGLLVALAACGPSTGSASQSAARATSAAFSATPGSITNTSGGTSVPANTPSSAATSGSPSASSGKPVCTGERPAQRRTDYKAPDDMHLDPNKGYIATIETVKGTINAELYPNIAPKTVNSFVFLACQGYFDGLTFHRYEPGFVIQGGDPAGNGTGGPGYHLPAEFNSLKHTAGVLSMARTSDPNSAGSQFFIMLGSAPHLDNQYSAFGKVIDGMDTVMKIRAGDKMTRVTVAEK